MAGSSSHADWHFSGSCVFCQSLIPMGIMTSTQWVVQSNKRWFLPQISSFQPTHFPTCISRGANRTKESFAAGASRFSHVDIFQAGSLPCFTIQFFKAWHFNAARPRRDREGGQQNWWPTLGQALSQENLWRHRHNYRRLFLWCFPSCFVIMFQLWNWALFQTGSPWQWTGERRLLLSFQRHCVHGKKMCEELELYGCTGSLLWW